MEQVRRIGSAQRPAGIIAALQVLRNRPNSRPTLGQIRVPTLIVVGSEDVLTPPSAAEGMARGVAGAKVVVLEEAGHLSKMERPEAFRNADEITSVPTWNFPRQARASRGRIR